MSRTLAEGSARRSKARRVAASAVGLLSLLALTGCSQGTVAQLKRLGLPEPASDRSPYMSQLWIGSWIAAGLIGVLVWGLIIWVMIRYRRRDDSAPTQVRYNLPIEMLYTVAPVIIIAVLFFFTVEKQDKINAPVAHPQHQVVVTAQQWSWTFNYLHEPAAGGQNVYDLGTPARFPELWLVRGQSVRFDLHSPDVIHSFWVPAFYFKLDVIPGRENTFDMTPTRLGIFEGHCAELCGLYHSRMLFEVHIVTPQAFAKHMRALKAAGQIGVLMGGQGSQTVAGLASSAGGAK
ncbi:MAG: aa3-type cytochrome oxidase subunit II [Nocardioidaceae bacterium]